MLACSCAPCPPLAQDVPYFVTYSHDMEEPGTLEFETKTALSGPDGSNGFGATAFELEYGFKAWATPGR